LVTEFVVRDEVSKLQEGCIVVNNGYATMGM